MTGGNRGAAPCLIIVGDPCSDFVRAMVRLSREYQVEAVFCDDVYTAVVAMARTAGRPSLVVGPIHALACEGGRFFQIAEGNSLRCCCFLDPRIFEDSVGMRSAMRAGAAIVGEIGEVHPVFKEWLSTAGYQDTRRSLCDLADEDLRATEAELRALLGQGTDA